MEKYFNAISTIPAVLGGVIVYMLGGWDTFAVVLLLMMGLDYFTGILKAIYKKELSSKIGVNGIIKKILTIVLVCVSVLCEKIGIPAVREITITFFIVNEGLSILENVSETGLKIPDVIKDTLLQIRETKGGK